MSKAKPKYKWVGPWNIQDGWHLTLARVDELGIEQDYPLWVKVGGVGAKALAHRIAKTPSLLRTK